MKVSLHFGKRFPDSYQKKGAVQAPFSYFSLLAPTNSIENLDGFCLGIRDLI